MIILENRGNNKVLVELTALDLANLVDRLNSKVSVMAVEEVAEDDDKTSVAIYESFNTMISGVTLALIECLKTKENAQKVYNIKEEEYLFLLLKQS